LSNPASQKVLQLVVLLCCRFEPNVTELELKLKAKDEELIRLKMRATHLEGSQRDLQVKDGEIQSLKLRIDDLEATVKEKDEKIHTWEANLMEKDEFIGELQGVVDEKDKEIKEKDEVIQARDTAVVSVPRAQSIEILDSNLV
jgi:uncharacterized protein (DUF3084 family)